MPFQMTAIYDSDIARVCSLSGIGRISGQLITFRQIESGIKQSIDEAAAAQSSEIFWSRMLLTAKLTKAACDAAISILSEWASPAGKLIGQAYKMTDTLADTATKSALGQKVDWMKTGNAMIANAVGSASAYSTFKGLPSADTMRSASNVIKIQKVKNDVVIDAMKSDEKSLRSDLVKYLGDLSSLAAEYGKEMAGDPAASKIWSGRKKAVVVVKEIANAGIKSYDAIVEYRNGGDEGIISARKALVSQSMLIQRKIGELQAQMNNCATLLDSLNQQA